MTGCPLLDSEYAARQNGKRLPCERLAEENDKLLMRLNAEHLVRQNVERENAKLRELVRNLLRVIPADVTGVVIGANTDHPTYYKFDEVFCELGIEVDG